MDITTDRHAQALTLSISGRIDSNNAEDFQQALLGEIDKGEQRLVLDLRELDYVSSAGLRVFLMAAKRLMPTDGGMALFGLQGNVREVFEISGFTSILTIRDDHQQALEAVD